MRKKQKIKELTKDIPDKEVWDNVQGPWWWWSTEQPGLVSAATDIVNLNLHNHVSDLTYEIIKQHNKDDVA